MLARLKLIGKWGLSWTMPRRVTAKKICSLIDRQIENYRRMQVNNTKNWKALQDKIVALDNMKNTIKILFIN